MRTHLRRLFLCRYSLARFRFLCNKSLTNCTSWQACNLNCRHMHKSQDHLRRLDPERRRWWSCLRKKFQSELGLLPGTTQLESSSLMGRNMVVDKYRQKTFGLIYTTVFPVCISYRANVSKRTALSQNNHNFGRVSLQKPNIFLFKLQANKVRWNYSFENSAYVKN